MIKTKLTTLPQSYVERLVSITQYATVLAFDESKEQRTEALKNLRSELAMMAKYELPIMEAHVSDIEKETKEQAEARKGFRIV